MARDWNHLDETTRLRKLFLAGPPDGEESFAGIALLDANGVEWLVGHYDNGGGQAGDLSGSDIRVVAWCRIFP